MLIVAMDAQPAKIARMRREGEPHHILGNDLAQNIQWSMTSASRPHGQQRLCAQARFVRFE
eukprot:1398578-Prymnesium_polylepis.2